MPTVPTFAVRETDVSRTANVGERWAKMEPFLTVAGAPKAAASSPSPHPPLLRRLPPRVLPRLSVPAAPAHHRCGFVANDLSYIFEFMRR